MDLLLNLDVLIGKAMPDGTASLLRFNLVPKNCDLKKKSSVQYLFLKFCAI